MLPEGWTESELAALSSAPISYGVVKPGDHDPKGVAFIRGGDFPNGRLDPTTLRTITREVSDQYRRTRLVGGEVLISLVGYPGACVVVPAILAGANIARQAAVIRPNARVSTEFLFQFVRSPIGQARLLGKTLGSAQQVINLKDLREVLVPTPPLPEQRMIAETLSTWDSAIATVEKLITNASAQKSALMQQLLSGKRRLPGFTDEWRIVSLADVVRIVTGSSNREDSTDVGEFTFFDRSTDIRRSDRFLFDAEAIIIGGEGQDFLPKYFVGKFDLHQRAYALFDFTNSDGKYVFYAVEHARHLLKRFSVGSTVASLRMGTFRKVLIGQPSQREQQAIAAILSECDRDILKLTENLTALRQEKTALMQQLLTGQRRVKLAAPAPPLEEAVA